MAAAAAAVSEIPGASNSLNAASSSTRPGGKKAAAAAAAEEAMRVTTYNTRRAEAEPAYVLYPRGNWRSYGSEKEMAAQAPPKQDRERPVTMHFQMKRDYFLRRRLPNFVNRDAADEGTSFLPHNNDLVMSDAYVRRMEAEASVQASRPKADHSTQTPSLRKTDFSVQVQPTIVDACNIQPNEGTGGVGTSNADNGNNNGSNVSAPPPETPEGRKRLGVFFERVMPRMLHHLTQAAAVPLFQDDFQLLMDEDSSAAVVSNRDESDLLEAGNFQHQYTRDRYIAAIDWKPGPRQIIAVASIRATSLEERLSAALDVEPSTTVIWNMHEQTNPQLLLESPTEALCVRFHPKPLSTIVIGGLSNGQVCLWDMARAPIDLRRVGGPAASQHAAAVAAAAAGGGAGGGGAQGAAAAAAAAAAQSSLLDDDVQVHIPPLPQPIRGHTTEIASDEHVVSRLQPLMCSRLENSHRRAVHDVAWLPDGLECRFDGRAAPQEQTYQFATVSEDGSVCIWDVRPDNIQQDKLRRLKKPTPKPNGEIPKLWLPILKYHLPRADGPGDLIGLRLHIEGRLNMGQGAPSYLMMVSTTEGELCCANWGPKPGTADAPRSVTGYDASGPSTFGGGAGGHAQQQAKVVRYISAAHAGPVWGMHRHPLLQDIFLTVGDWGFKVWRVGVEQPILSSPLGEQQTTCGRWSPTRPGLVFIGTRDGFVHVWDLLDRSHQPILVHPVIKDAITCIEFRPLQNPTGKHVHRQTQTIALGTKVGSLYFFELPRALVRGPTSELKNARSLFDRETRRVSYYSWRWEERRKELEVRAAAVTVDGGAGAEGEDGKGAAATAAAAKKAADNKKGGGQHHDDLLGGKEEEGAGDFVFTAEDDSQYLALVEALAKEDPRMQKHYQQSAASGAAHDDDDMP